MMPTTADPDVALALLYVPMPARANVTALFALDARCAGIVRGAREPMLAAIKLAWWRERIEALPGVVPDEPLLHALAGVTPASGLGAIVEAWEAILDGEIATGHAARGGALFAAAAGSLRVSPPPWLAAAGAVWAQADAVRHGEASEAPPPLPPLRWPAALRPLGMLTMLAMRDGREPQGTPWRALRMIRHRLTGR